jgi:hypothetical protein
MQETLLDWSDQERDVARRVFDLAYQREIDSLIDVVRQRSGSLSSVESVWDLHDYLSCKRHEMDGRFDFRLANLLFVFASLVKEGVVRLDELEGLSNDKLAKIGALSSM